MKLGELYNKMFEHNKKNNITTQYGDTNPLYGVVVFSNDSFDREYPIESRSYEFRSDNKYFIVGMGGNSIFADSLDKTDHIRLDWYDDEWIVEDCYIKEQE